jgi:hypothetical protein
MAAFDRALGLVLVCSSCGGVGDTIFGSTVAAKVTWTQMNSGAEIWYRRGDCSMLSSWNDITLSQESTCW